MTSAPLGDPQSTAPLAGTPGEKPGAGLGEFLLIGGLTPVLYLLSWILRRSLGLNLAEHEVGFTMFLAAFVVNDPHFAVTYLLFYRDARTRAFGDAFAPAQRARYLVAGALVPAALAAWAVAGLAMKSATSVGWMIQLMFLLVGWHYVKQGFGVMVVLAARRGVTFRPRERLVILAHGYVAWAHAWASHTRPNLEVEEQGVVYTTLDLLPPGIDRFTRPALLATVILLAGMLIRKWRIEGRLPLVAPLTALLCSIWAWSIYSGIDPLVRYMVPALHSAQYLYFVGLLSANEARERSAAPFFESSRARLGLLAASALALGWVLFHGAPWALDGAVSRRDRGAALGPTPYFAALYTFVNIHHYFMDNVIWRRENPLTRYLTRRGIPARS
jgi:hypothetical protein